MDLPDRVIGEAYRFGAWDTVAALTDIGNRMAGSEGEQAAMETLADALRDAGAREVGIERFEFPGWERGESSLSLSERRYDHQHQLLALPGGPSGAVTAPVVDVGHGTPAEFEAADVAGALALASSATPEDHDRWLHRREKYSFAVEAGAAGFLFRNHVPGNLPPTGDVGERDGPGAIPAAGISRELGERLVRRCAREDELEATLRVDCRSEQMESGNVSGRLGPDTGETVLVTAHHDAHDIAEGARDNGAGCALVVQLARMLAAVEADLETTVRFVTFGAEEVGLRGSRQFVARADLSDVRAVVNCDAVGKSRDLAVHTNGFEGLPDPFEAGADDVGVPVTIREEIAPHSDHWPFVRQGVPGVMAASSGGDDRGWGHTHGDTLDKLDRRDLRELAVPLASAVLDIATGDPPADHVDPETIERRAEQEGHVLEDPN
jgi:aminopeptidase YwaD